MREYLADWLPWLLSALTIYMNWLAGRKDPRAWIVGLVAQVLWALWIWAGRSWGLVPLNIALWIVYLRNYRLWSRP